MNTSDSIYWIECRLSIFLIIRAAFCGKPQKPGFAGFRFSLHSSASLRNRPALGNRWDGPYNPCRRKIWTSSS